MTEAAEVFKASGGKRPLKHLWTREDDMRGGFYRPMYVHRLKGGDRRGRQDRRLGARPSSASRSWARRDLDETSVEGASNLPYAIANLRVSAHNEQLAVPPLWWRSVGHTHTGFAVETFVDELLQMAGKDPVEGRLALLTDEPRYAGVLKTVAEMADWGSAVPEGRERGVAVARASTPMSRRSPRSRATKTARRACTRSGAPSIAAWPINPNVIKAQMEGGIGYGLGAVLFDEITLGEGGKIMQSNFHDYRSLRINEMPHVEVAVIASTEKPTGVGEPGVPPIGPAVANAWRRLTGEAGAPPADRAGRSVVMSSAAHA